MTDTLDGAPEFTHRLLPTTSSGSMRGAAVRGIAWSAATRVVVQVLQFVGTAVVSRVLLPSEYGLAAIVATLAGFGMMFSQLGLGAAVVQSRRLREDALSSAFWLNAVAGVVLTLLFAALARPIANLFGQPALTDLVLVSSLGFTLSLGVVHLAILQRGLQFRLMGLLDVLGAAVQVAVTVALAHAGAGAASLVWGVLAQQVTLSVAVWAVVRWRPRVRPTRAALRELWAFGGSLLGFNVVNFWGRNADNLLVGKVTGPAALGLYARAYTLMLLPVQQVTDTLGRVLFATFARLAEDPPRLRTAYLRSIRSLLAVSLPASLGLAVTAPALIASVYGPRWTGAAALLTILAMSAPAQVVGGTTGALYQAMGRTGEQFRRGSLSVAATLLAVVIGLHWGAAGVATAVSIKSVVFLPYITAGCWPVLGVTWRDVLAGTRGPLVAAVVMAGTVAGVDAALLSDVGPVTTLLLQVYLGAATYVLVLRVLDPALIETGLAGIRRSRARKR